MLPMFTRSNETAIGDDKLLPDLSPLTLLQANNPRLFGALPFSESKGSAMLAPKKQTDYSKIRQYEHRMVGHAEQTVQRYLELAKLTKDSLKPVQTPCIDDHLLPPEDFITK